MAKCTPLARLGSALALLAAVLAFTALPARAETYEDTVAQLQQLQALAGSYAAQGGTDQNIIDLTLSYTRGSSYNNAMWQLVAGAQDADFVAYVKQQAPELENLPYVGTVALPNGQDIDFSHLLASMQLVYRGMPVAGGWGGDSMQLARTVQGQAADADGYMALLQGSFNSEGESVFGGADLRADMDAVILGAQLAEGSDLAGLLRSYYTADLNDYDRAYQFIALSFGSVDAGDQAAFRDAVYGTLTEDTGMQLLLYLNGMWQKQPWQVQPDAEPVLRATCDLLADHLAGAVNSEHVKSDNSTRMTTLAGAALVDALGALGDADAANAAAAALDDVAEGPSTVDGKVDGVIATLRSGFNVKLFRAIMMILAGFAGVGLAACAALTVRDLRRQR